MLAVNEFELEELEDLVKTTFLVHIILVKLKNQNYCNNIIAKYPNRVFDADDFNSLPGKTDEVLDRIEPYKKILEKQLWKDVNHHF
ncbi:hypothetical protein Glove_682g29 [Diversispora epigaea]|uniref:Uncharacterized protein n=1 Tax=Diversispora epigaea TaxID=1348612 RepID=A0A397G7D8_9GLOM|nr:hypothetical protein Glove_682g29 [Diversispora epigaea]